MKEIGYFQLTFMRWGFYFLLLSIAQRINLFFWPETIDPAWWTTLLGGLLMAVLIPLLSGWHKTRKVFVQDVGKATDGTDA